MRQWFSGKIRLCHLHDIAVPGVRFPLGAWFHFGAMERERWQYFWSQNQHWTVRRQWFSGKIRLCHLNDVAVPGVRFPLGALSFNSSFVLMHGI